MKTKQIPPKSKAQKTIEFKWFIALAIFITTTLIFFWEHIFGNAFFWEDFAEYVYPVQSFAAREFAAGKLPFWNPYSFAGMPFLADIQVGFFYPLNRVLSLFVVDGSLPVKVLEMSLILHFLIAQLSMFFLMRYFKISFWASNISAISYGFSFLLVCHAIHPMIVIHLSWFPLIFMFYHKSISNTSIKDATIAGLLLGMIMLSGHPQMTLYISLFLGAFFLWNFVADLKNSHFKNISITKYLISSLIPFIIAAGIFQVQYLQSNELAELSRRQEMTFEEASEGSLEIPQFITSVVPKFFGYQDASGTPKVAYYLKKHNTKGEEITPQYYYYWETAYYFGIVALMLGLVGAAGLFKKNRLITFLSIFSIFAFIFALGNNGFIYYIFHKMPFFSQLRIPARMMFAVAFAFSIIAGFAIDNLKNFSLKQILIPSILPVIIALMASIGLLQSFFSTEESSIKIIQTYGTTALFFAIITFILIFIAYKGKINLQFTAALFALIAFVDLYIAGADFNRSNIDYSQQYNLPQDALKAFRSKYPDDIFRVNSRIYNPPYMAMKRNQGLISEIELLEGYNPLVLSRNVPPLTRDEIHKLFNVKYEIAIDSIRGVPYFAERKDRLPRAWLVGSTIIMNEDEVANFMKNNNLDYSKIAVIEKQTQINLPAEIDTNFSGNAKILEYSANKIKIETNSDKPSLLCLSEIYYPAWQAKIDGQQTEIIRANYCFRSIPLPAGNHIVEMEFASKKFTLGLWTTIATLGLSIILLIISCKEKKTI